MRRTFLITSAIGLLAAHSPDIVVASAYAAPVALAQTPGYLPESPYQKQRRAKPFVGSPSSGKAYVPPALSSGGQPFKSPSALPFNAQGAPPALAAPAGQLKPPVQQAPLVNPLPALHYEPVSPLYTPRTDAPALAGSPAPAVLAAPQLTATPQPPAAAPTLTAPNPDAPDFKPFATLETQKTVPVDPRHYQAVPAVAQPLPSPPVLSPHYAPTIPDPAPAAALPTPQPVITPEPPVAKSVPAAAVIEAAHPLEGGRQLTEETQRILSHLPGNLDKPVQAPTTKMGVSRVNPDLEGLLGGDDEDVQSYEGGGMSMQVRAPRYDAGYELEKAYNALIAGETEIAIEIYKDILSQSPNEQQALFGLATTYHRVGEVDQARPYYGRLLRINPSHREALNNFLVLVAEESPQEALRQLESLEQENPEYSPIPAQMAILYDKLGYPDEARSKMIRASNLSPENLVYKYNLAIMLDKQGKYSDAASLYSKLIAAANKGHTIPADPRDLQERLTFIGSNKGQ